jgi:hypothetical protein
MTVLTAFPLLSEVEMSPLISRGIEMVTGGVSPFDDEDSTRCVTMLIEDEQYVIRLVDHEGGAVTILASAYIHRRLGLIRTMPFTGLIEDDTL